MLNVTLIGFGYWGPNLARVFNSLPGCKLRYISEQSPERQNAARDQYPDVAITDDDVAITSSEVDVVVIATPVFTHYDLACKALEHGKHVWLEKPMAPTSEQCRSLVELAAKQNRCLMVDHTFLFTPPVRKIKELIESGALGTLYYFDSVRVNLGLFQHDVNVIWDLAPHDFSIMDYLLGSNIKAISAQGSAHFNTGLEDVAYVTVHYPDNLIAHFHLNWLAPTKMRRTVVGGSKQMLVWDDLNPDEKIRIYDKGAEVTTLEGRYGIQASYRTGDVTSPWLDSKEALRLEGQYFLDCINKGEAPFNDGNQGLRVVSLLEATDESLKSGGKLIELKG